MQSPLTVSHGYPYAWQYSSRSSSYKATLEVEFSLPYSQGAATIPIINHMNWVHILIPCIFKIHFNIVFPSVPTSPQWFFPWDYPNKILNVFLTYPIRATCPTYPILRDLLAPKMLLETFSLLLKCMGHVISKQLTDGYETRYKKCTLPSLSFLIKWGYAVAAFLRNDVGSCHLRVHR